MIVLMGMQLQNRREINRKIRDGFNVFACGSDHLWWRIVKAHIEDGLLCGELPSGVSITIYMWEVRQ